MPRMMASPEVESAFHAAVEADHSFEEGSVPRLKVGKFTRYLQRIEAVI